MKLSEISVELIDSMGSDLSVVNAARVSFAKESQWEYEYDKHDGHGPEKLSERDAKLINYLAKHNHFTPFTHCFASFRIKAPIFVARQLVKHQVGLSWNEVSRRYVDDEPEFWFPKEWRGKPVNAKQGSDGVLEFANEPYIKFLIGELNRMYLSCVEDAQMAPEQCRMWLPQNMMTEWIWSGSLAAFVRVCKLRLDPHAQLESQLVAGQIKGLLEPLFPVSFGALLNGS